MRISAWSSDVCSSDLVFRHGLVVVIFDHLQKKQPCGQDAETNKHQDSGNHQTDTEIMLFVLIILELGTHSHARVLVSMWIANACTYSGNCDQLPKQDAADAGQKITPAWDFAACKTFEYEYNYLRQHKQHQNISRQLPAVE